VLLSYLNALNKRRTVIAFYGRVEIGCGEREGEMSEPTWWEVSWADDHDIWPVEEPPTHWMPLPEPPK
jgi:Protein of unknown function (DUF551)